MTKKTESKKKKKKISVKDLENLKNKKGGLLGTRVYFETWLPGNKNESESDQ